MLHKKSILTSILMLVLFTTSAMAQCSQADVLAVVNKADWCPVCENNGERAMKALKSSNEDGTVKFVGNDLTNDETKKKSAAKLKEHGLYEKMKSENSTGVVYFFDASSKELISTISVKKSNKKLTAAVKSATSD
jgi:predicted transcriptional regulator